MKVRMFKVRDFGFKTTNLETLTTLNVELCLIYLPLLRVTGNPIGLGMLLEQRLCGTGRLPSCLRR